MNLKERIRGILGQLFLQKIGTTHFLKSLKTRIIWSKSYNFLFVFRIRIVVIAIGPEPQLGVAVNTMSKNWGWLQTFNIIFDILRLNFGESFASAKNFRAGITADTAL
jgi:hypothetical protein